MIYCDWWPIVKDVPSLLEVLICYTFYTDKALKSIRIDLKNSIVMFLLHVWEYSRSEYEYKYKYWAVKYEYIASKYKYLKCVLEY